MTRMQLQKLAAVVRNAYTGYALAPSAGMAMALRRKLAVETANALGLVDGTPLRRTFLEACEDTRTQVTSRP